MTANAVVIRPCERADLPAVAALQSDLAAEDVLYGYVAETIEALQQRLGSMFLVACWETELVGYVYGTTHISEGMAVIPTGEAYLSVDELYVVPALRNQGIGSRLMDAIMQIAATQAINRCLVYSANRDLGRVMQFYRRHGFQSWYVQMFR